jgi:hypothetical protein
MMFALAMANGLMQLGGFSAETNGEFARTQELAALLRQIVNSIQER